jgi:hypothetical protein
LVFVIKAEVSDLQTKTFAFTAQKTMYGGKHIGNGDTVFVFASENEGGQGLIARGTVTAAKAVAKLPLGRSQLKQYTNWDDGRPETELNFKFYRQATNKIGGISDEAAAFLDGFF